MQKLNSKIFKDENSRLSRVQIFRGSARKKAILDVAYVWDSEGIVQEINVTSDTLTATELLWIINEKFIERIGRIGQIDNVDVIGNIKNAFITVNTRADYISNGTFEAGLESWIVDGAVINTTPEYVFEGSNSVKLTLSQSVSQRVPSIYSNDFRLNLKVKSMGAMSDTFIILTFSDGTSENIILDVVPGDVGTFLEVDKTSVTSGKYVTLIRIYNPIGYPVYIDSVKAPKIQDRATVTLLLSNVKIGVHENTVYKNAYVALTADGNIIGGVANKLIYVHWVKVVMGADTEGVVYDKSGGNIIDKLPHNDREGFVSGFVPFPAAIWKSQVGEELYWDMTSATGEAHFTIVYSEQSS